MTDNDKPAPGPFFTLSDCDHDPAYLDAPIPYRISVDAEALLADGAVPRVTADELAARAADRALRAIHDRCGLPGCDGPKRCATDGCAVLHPNGCSADKSLRHWRCHLCTTVDELARVVLDAECVDCGDMFASGSGHPRLALCGQCTDCRGVTS